MRQIDCELQYPYTLLYFILYCLITVVLFGDGNSRSNVNVSSRLKLRLGLELATRAVGSVRGNAAGRSDLDP